MEKIQIKIGDIKIGAGAPVSVQSMTNTKTDNIEATLYQINELAEAGCEIVRLAVLNKDCAAALKEIKQKSPVPLVADIHFDYRLALAAMEAGIDALRGNIGGEDHVKKVVEMAKKTQTPIRIGVNGGSLEKYLIEDKTLTLAQKMVKSAMAHIKILEENDFNMIKVSLKSSDVQTTIDAYRMIYEKIPYPLHLGVTEAGTLRGGIIKSAIGLGSLLSQGIGDTIRVSLTENPVEEVKAGFEILKALKLRNDGINFVSCPTCGRCQIDLISLAHQVEDRFRNKFDERFKKMKQSVTIATMGCPVNGPNEAKDADYGVAGAIGEGYIFKKGVLVKKVKEENLLDEFEKIIIQDFN